MAVTCPHCCTWSQDSDGSWDTKCGEKFELTNGGPTENNMRFCYGCGEHILESPFEEEETDPNGAPVPDDNQVGREYYKENK